MKSWIERTARQRDLRISVVSVAITLLMGFLFYSNAGYWRSLIQGPVAVSGDELRAIDPLRISTPFVKVTGSRVVDSGVQEETTDAAVFKHITAGYFALAVPDGAGASKMLLVKSKTPPTTQVSGSLGALPFDLDQALFADDTDGSQRAKVYPLLLDAAAPNDGALVSIFWALVVLGPTWFFGGPALYRLATSKPNRAVARMMTWGPLGETSEMMERELASGVRLKHKGFRFTDKYLVRMTFFGFEVMRWDDLLWFYRSVTKRSVNFIPVGADLVEELKFTATQASIKGNKQQTEQIAALVAARAPWATEGFNDSLAEIYAKNRGELIAYVQARKAGTASS